MTEKKLTKEEILHLAKLVELNLSDKEVEKYQKQLSETLKYIENLKQIDTSSTTLIASTAAVSNIFQKDEISKERILSLSQVLANAKAKKNNYFTANRILFQESENHGF